MKKYKIQRNKKYVTNVCVCVCVCVCGGGGGGGCVREAYKKNSCGQSNAQIVS